MASAKSAPGSSAGVWSIDEFSVTGQLVKLEADLDELDVALGDLVSKIEPVINRSEANVVNPMAAPTPTMVEVAARIGRSATIVRALTDIIRNIRPAVT